MSIQMLDQGEKSRDTFLRVLFSFKVNKFISSTNVPTMCQALYEVLKIQWRTQQTWSLSSRSLRYSGRD